MLADEVLMAATPVYEWALDHLLNLHAIDAIIHFAGVKAVAESVVNPAKYYSNNVRGGLTLFEAAARHGIRRLVFSSSATVYGNNQDSPLREYLPRQPDNAYGRGKCMVEEYLTDLSRADPSWHAVILRYFNPVGAHPSGLMGEAPLGAPNNLMPIVCQVADGQRPEPAIFGDDYPTADGTAIRDYIHVLDLARGHVDVLQAALGNEPGLIFNLETSQDTSVRELVATFEQVNGVSVPCRIAGRRDGDVAVTYADVTLAHERLGWRASLTLEDMCRDAWRWQQQNPQGYSRKPLPDLQDQRVAAIGIPAHSS